MHEFVLPKGWQWKKLGDLPDSKGIFCDGDWVESKDQDENGEIRLIQLADIGDGFFIDKSRRFLNKPTAIRLRCTFLNQNDILISRMPDPLGRACIFPFDEDEKYVTVVDAAILRLNPVRVLPQYACFMINSASFRNRIWEERAGATRQRISRSRLGDLLIPLPPLPTQQKIVAKIQAAFARLDEAIERQKLNIQRTENLKKAVLEEVFADGTWEKKKIEEIAHVKGGKRLPMGKTLSVEKTRFPYIRVADFNDSGTVDLEKIKYLDEETQKSIKNYTITSDDLYISIAGTIGLTGIIPSELNGANLTENAAKLIFKDPTQVDKRFVYYFTISKYFIDQVSDATKTVAQPKLALTRLAQIQIPVPKPISVQRQIVAHLDRIFAHADELLAAQRGRLARLEALKKSILEEAFRGELVS